MLSMLIRLMLAQAQECLFEKIALPGIRNQFYSLMKMAQEAAKVNNSTDTQLSHCVGTVSFLSCALKRIYCTLSKCKVIMPPQSNSSLL